MPVAPFFAAIGTALGATAGAATAVGVGATVATGAAIYSGVSSAQASAAQNKALKAASTTPDASQTVGDLTANQTAQAQNNGRAALVYTSPSGVQGTDPTGRRKLLGND